jgi:nicotinate-nucleotide--dimethylbenzimidazole phosphoribosyltransferase
MTQKLFSAEDVRILEEIILHRRDVRGNRFLQTPLPDDVIEKIILSALHGPSVGFSQPWEFVLIRDPEQKQKIRATFDTENERASVLFDAEKSEQYAKMKLEGILEAPISMAVFYKPSRTAVLGQTSMKEVGLYSVVCAIQNMWLMARALNVGIGWVSILDPEKVRDILNAPAENQLVAYLCLGYVKEFLDKPELEILAWEKRKHLQQVLIQEKYKAAEKKTFSIAPLQDSLTDALLHKIDFKTKPRGALGRLEEIALQIGRIQNTLSPVLTKPVILVFAADHGIAKEGVSAYPQEVTYQMVMNFLSGGAAINVFCNQNGIDINIVDAGVNYDFPDGLAGLTRCKIGRGTKSFLHEPAMTPQETQKSIEAGAKIVRDLQQQGSNIIGFGEMGIGNTASASALMSVLCKRSIEKCVGQGTGIGQEALEKKKAIISQAIAFHGKAHTPFEALTIFGGFEIAQMCGGMLQAAELGMVILVDGFISTAAFLVAAEMEPSLKGYAIFCHQSGEQGHRVMLDYLQANSLLNLGMRLGEGTGAAMAYPVIQAAVSFLNEMASFESAGVSDKEKA